MPDVNDAKNILTDFLSGCGVRRMWCQKSVAILQAFHQGLKDS